jgi:hypothetical protein
MAVMDVCRGPLAWSLSKQGTGDRDCDVRTSTKFGMLSGVFGPMEVVSEVDAFCNDRLCKRLVLICRARLCLRRCTCRR